MTPTKGASPMRNRFRAAVLSVLLLLPLCATNSASAGTLYWRCTKGSVVAHVTSTATAYHFMSFGWHCVRISSV